MKGKIYLLAFLLSILLCFFFFGCVEKPDRGAPPVVEANGAGPSPIQEPRDFTLEDLIKEAVYNANKEAFTMGVQGFEEEWEGKEKTPFSHYEGILKNWYCESLVANLETFYDSHLGYWGYEMGFAFPLHNWSLLEEAFLSLENKGDGRVEASFRAQTGHEELKILTYSLTEEPEGRWLVTRLEEKEAGNP